MLQIILFQETQRFQTLHNFFFCVYVHFFILCVTIFKKIFLWIVPQNFQPYQIDIENRYQIKSEKCLIHIFEINFCLTPSFLYECIYYNNVSAVKILYFYFTLKWQVKLKSISQFEFQIRKETKTKLTQKF